MRTSRALAVGAVALTGALALSACGSDNNNGGASGSGGAGGASTGGASAAAASCFSGKLNGEGSTAQKNAIEAAIKAYQTACSDATINYNATGSGAGIKQFTGKQVDFAGSDSALKTDEAAAAKTACGSDAWNLPMVAGPIAIAYNVKGVTNLVLNADVAAKIFNGVVTTWNDPAITALNSGASLSATPIKVFFRSDESGTTENFTDYLSKVVPQDWPYEVSGDWPVKGGEAAQGTSGVVEAVSAGDGTIGYADASQAGELGVANIKVGKDYQEPTPEAAAKILEESPEAKDLAKSPYMYPFELDRKTESQGVYPIVLVSYLIACTEYGSANEGALVKGYLEYVISPEGQKVAAENAGSAPLSS